MILLSTLRENNKILYDLFSFAQKTNNEILLSIMHKIWVGRSSGY